MKNISKDEKKRKIRSIIITVAIAAAVIFLFGNRNFRQLLILNEEIKRLDDEIAKL